MAQGLIGGLVVAIGLIAGGCGIHAPRAGSSATNMSDAVMAQGISFNVIEAGFPATSIQVDPVQRQVQVSGIPSGRIWNFSVLENGQAPQNLSCPSPLPLIGSIEGNRLHFDFGLQPTAGTVSLNCQTEAGPFKLTLAYNASRVAVVSSNVGVLLASSGANSVPSESPDGRYVAWVNTEGSTGSAGQVLWTDRQTGLVRLVSSAANGTVGNGPSFTPQIAADGQHVLFRTNATNLTTPAPVSGGSGVYWKNIQTGAITTPDVSDPTHVSKTPGIVNPRITPDGRYLVFQSTYAEVDGASNRPVNVYRKDLQGGSLVLVNTSDGQTVSASLYTSTLPQITSDGRYVIFQAAAEFSSSPSQIYRKDLVGGSLTLVSSTDGTVANAGNHSSTVPQISTDGRFVTMQSTATNFVAAVTGSQIYRKDLQTQAFALVSSLDGTASHSDGSSTSANPHMSTDGRFVAFESASSSWGAPSASPATTQVYLRDLNAGGGLTLVSSTDGTAAHAGEGSASLGDLSPDGRFVAFSSGSVNFSAANYGSQIYLRDAQATALVLVTDSELRAFAEDTSHPVPGPFQTAYLAASPQLDPAGKFAVFASYSTNLMAGAHGEQIYLKNLATGQVTLVSSLDGTVAHQDNSGTSNSPQISADDRYVYFLSAATNFVKGASHIGLYRKDLTTGALALVTAAGPTLANADCISYTSTSDGRYALFFSTSNNLLGNLNATLGFESTISLFRKDMQTGSIALASSTDGTVANQDTNAYEPGGIAVTPDGRYVFYVTDGFFPSLGTLQLIRKDMQGGEITLVSSTDGTPAHADNAYQITGVQVTPDGRYVVFESNGTTLLSGEPPAKSGTYGTYEVLMKDLQTGAITLVSSTDGTVAHQSTSYCGSPQITPDAHFVLYGCADYQVYRKDLKAGTIALVSSVDGTKLTQGVPAQLSSDGRYALITSTSTLVAGTASEIYWVDLGP